MKYSESYSKSRMKGSAAFYIIIACCLLAIGGASWFAVSNFKEKTPESSSSASSLPNKLPEVSSAPESSVPTPAADVADPVSDVPYTSSASSQPKPESTPAPSVFSMPVQGEVIKGYSDKELQYSVTFGDMRVHTGLDIACELGTSVSSAANGKVTSVEENGVLGNVVTIDHGNGITAKYASLKDVPVKAGDTVTAGDIIGTVSTVPSECADQSHLHIEVYKNGHAASPLDALNNN